MFICLFKWYFFPLILLCWAQYISDYSLHKRQAYISKIHTMGKSIHMKWPISSWTIISKILSNFIQNSLDAWDRIIMKFANFYSSFSLKIESQLLIVDLVLLELLIHYGGFVLYTFLLFPSWLDLYRCDLTIISKILQNLGTRNVIFKGFCLDGYIWPFSR